MRVGIKQTCESLSFAGSAHDHFKRGMQFAVAIDAGRSTAGGADKQPVPAVRSEA